MLNSTLEKISHWIKLGALIAPLLGAYFLISFFAENKIPIPSDSQSVLFLLPVVAAVGLIAALYLFIGILSPALFFTWLELDLELLFDSGAKLQRCRTLPSQYFYYFGGTLAFLIAWGSSSIFIPDVNLSLGFLSWIIYFVLVLIKVSVTRNFSKSTFFQCVGILISTNIVLVLWFMAACYFSSKFLNKSYPSYEAIQFVFVSLLLVVFHFLQVVSLGLLVKPEKRNSVAAFVLGVTFLCSLFPPMATFLGKASLFALGLGGDKPIHIELSKSHVASLPQDLVGKIEKSEVIYMAFRSPSRIFIRADRNAHPISDISLKVVDKLEYLSKDKKVNYIQYSPYPESK